VRRRDVPRLDPGKRGMCRGDAIERADCVGGVYRLSVNTTKGAGVENRRFR
jgi:hypothetical protein